ncbi:hypothetical protein BG621_00425 [Parasaccharibacter apium]|nr:hypothetical protein BG621_00425 [Parasaccharibacter apium]
MRLTPLPYLFGLLLLGACSSLPDPAHDPYGTWVGKLVTDEGICPTKNVSSLRIRGKDIVFNPGMTSSVLRGTYQQGQQSYHAELVDQGMNNTPYRQVFEGYPVGTAIGGNFTTPRCHAHITLTRR